MRTLHEQLSEIIAHIEAPSDKARGADKKNYTERISHQLSELLASHFRMMGLDGVKAPQGRDKQFMGGYGTKGVDVYLSDEKHGLLLSCGVKGLLF